MNVPELIRRKRDGQSLTPEEIADFIDGYVAGSIPDYQVAAFLMAVYMRGLTPDEAAALTRSMMNSGNTFALRSISSPKVDKHSTGGVGDKISLPLAPLVAAAGGTVPMVSGRGLGHTGGTLDKLDAIPGYRWALTEQEFETQLKRVGCAIIGQTDNFVPADKRLYALRDVTATVESMPLICASILSKKAAAGTKYLVMDVKCGSGAFMDTQDKARELARALIDIGRVLGLRVSAMLTQMNQPLGAAVGNALEVRESIDILKGCGPEDARNLTLELGAEMLVLAGLASSRHSALERLTGLIKSGAALEKFIEWITAQGGDPRIVDDYTLLEVSGDRVDFPAARAGWITAMQTRQIGVAANTLGAGRQKTDDAVDLGVGFIVHKKVGDRVEAGEPILTIHHRGGRGLAEAQRMLAAGITIGDAAVDRLPLIIETVGTAG